MDKEKNKAMKALTQTCTWVWMGAIGAGRIVKAGVMAIWAIWVIVVIGAIVAIWAMVS